jgi:hypothetical protein
MDDVELITAPNGVVASSLEIRGWQRWSHRVTRVEQETVAEVIEEFATGLPRGPLRTEQLLLRHHRCLTGGDDPTD